MKPRAEGRLDPECGISLTEIGFAVCLIFVLSVLIVSSLAQLSRTQAHTRGQAHVAAVADGVARALEADAALADRVFGFGTTSQAYLARLDWNQSELLTGSRLPLLCDRGYFDQDPPTVVETGNMLFVVRSAGVCLAELNPPGLTPDVVRVDLFRFVLYHAADTSRGLDLRRWCSVPFANHSDLANVVDPNRRAAVGLRLLQQGVQHALEVDQPVAQALWRFESSGELVRMESTEKIPAQPEECRDSLLGLRRVALARNGAALPGLAVPRYAKADRQFPGGFEVKWDGPATGRLILLRLALVFDDGDGRPNHVEVARLVNQ